MLTTTQKQDAQRLVVDVLVDAGYSRTDAIDLTRVLKQAEERSALAVRRERIATAVLSGLLANQNQVTNASYLTSIVVRLAEDLIKELDK